MFLSTVREHFVVNLIIFELHLKKLCFDFIKGFKFFPLDFVKRFFFVFVDTFDQRQ